MRGLRTILRTGTGLWVVALLCGCADPPPAPFAPPAENIDEILRDAVERGAVAGVVAMAATREGPVYRGAFGQQNVSTNVAMAPDSIFRIASMTKAITSVAVMQLVEQGQVELDAPASRYLPELADREVLEGFDGTERTPRLRAAKSAITVRQLLTHTSGFAYELWNASILELVTRGELPSVGELGPGFLAAPLVFDPGTAWEYGINTDWLGRLVEEVSGQTLDAYFREHIFEPLHMEDSHFNLPVDKHPRLVTVHQREKGGGLVESPAEPPPVVTFFGGGAGLLSTAEDYLRFLRALLGDGANDRARILKSETVAAMARNQIGEFEAGTLTTVMPAFSNDIDLLPDSADGFGLGFLLNSEAVDGGRAAGSLAWAGLYNSYFWIDRERGVCGVLMAQILPFYDSEVLELFDRFERAVYATTAGE